MAWQRQTVQQWLNKFLLIEKIDKCTFWKSFWKRTHAHTDTQRRQPQQQQRHSSIFFIIPNIHPLVFPFGFVFHYYFLPTGVPFFFGWFYPSETSRNTRHQRVNGTSTKFAHHRKRIKKDQIFACLFRLLYSCFDGCFCFVLFQLKIEIKMKVE